MEYVSVISHHLIPLAAEFYEHAHPHTTDRKECIHWTATTWRLAERTLPPPHTLATPQSAGPASLHTCLFNSWFCLFLLNYKLLCCVKFVAFILFRVNKREIMWRVLVTQRKIVDLINIGLESDTVTVLTIFKIETLKSIHELSLVMLFLKNFNMIIP